MTRRVDSDTAPKSVDGFRAWLVEALSPLGIVDVRKLFGGAGLYLDDLIIGVVDDGRLYLKVDDGNRPSFEAAGMQPFEYRPGQRMKSYWSVPPDVLEDDRTLREWAKRSHAASARAATRSIRPRRPARPK